MDDESERRLRTSVDLGLAVPTDDELGPKVLEILSRYAALNIFRYLGLAPGVVGPMLEFIASLMDLPLDSKLREIAILRIGVNAHSEYEIFQHTAVARTNGVTEEELAVVLAPEPVTTLSADVNLLCKVADELETTARLSDETMREFQGRWDPPTVTQWLLIMGAYSFVSRFLNGARVPLEAVSPLVGHGSATG